MDAKLHSAAVLIAVAFAVTSASGDTYTSEGYLQDGLVAQWDAINNTGAGYHVPDATTWKDIAGGGYDLSLMAGGSWTAAGTSLTVNKGSAKGNTAAPAYKTIEVVYKMTDKSGRILFNSGSDTKHFVLFNDNGTKGFFDGSNRNTPYVAWTYDATAIRSMAATYSDDVIVNAVYKDGVSPNAGNITSNWGTGDGKIMIGDRAVAGTTYAWSGEVYTIRLYDKALTPEQIAANHAVDVARFQGAAPRLVKQPTFAGSTVTVRHTAGLAGDSHVLRLVWDTTSIDHGTDYAAWPNNEKIADIADDSTSTTFTTPAAIVAAGQVCCRAVLTKQDGTPVAVSALVDFCTLDPAADYVLSGPTGFFAPAGETNVYSGLISGTGPAIIYGGGTVAFSHANNTYSGGTLVSNVVFRLDADGCAGTGAITAAVNTAHVFMNCANVPNSMRFLSAYSSYKSNLLKGEYPPEGTLPLYPIRTPVTVSGNVSFAASAKYVSGSSSYSSNPTVTYEGDFVADSGKCVDVCAYGTTKFKGKFVSRTSNTSFTDFGMVASGKGTLEFHSSSNVVPIIRTYNASLQLHAADVLPNTVINYEYGSAGYCKTYLNGHDQTILGMSWRTSKDGAVPGETTTGQCFTSEDDPATLRIVGCSSSHKRTGSHYDNMVAILGKITLVMDVDSTFTADGFYQCFTNRLSNTTGDLIISNGDFRVAGMASFPNVPRIYVGEGGSFSNSSMRASAFAGCTNLTVLGTMSCTGDETPFGFKTMDVTLGTGASFSLPAGATVTVLSLKVGDTELPDGTYGDGGTAVSQIKRGTVVVQGIHETVTGTWTGGGGADTSIGTAENWDSGATPNFANASLIATFATGGISADIDRNLSLRGIALSKPDTGFSFTGTGHTIGLDADGIAFNDATPAADGSPRLYSFEPQVQQLQQFDQSFAIPTNVTVNFAGGYLQTQSGTNVKTGDGTLRLAGNSGTPGSWAIDGGSVEFAGTNQIDGAITVTNATVKFSGAITRAGGPDTAAYQWQWRPGATHVRIDCKPRANNIPVSRIILDNADFSKSVGIFCPSLDAGQGWFNVAAGSTNIFRSLTYLIGSIGYINLGAESKTTFAGQFAVDGETRFRGSGTIVLKGSTPSISGGGLRFLDNTVCRIEKSGMYSAGGTLLLQGNARLELVVDNAFSMSPSRDYWILMYEAGTTLDLGGTVQNLVLFGMDSNNSRYGNMNATVTGLPGSELRIKRGYIFHNVTNSVSLTAIGAANEVLVATNKAFVSYGDVKAESGTLDFARNASWRNGTNVTVCGGATLKINNPSGTFGDHAVLRVEGDGWAMALGTGVRQKFAEFYIDGERQPNGLYGAADNEAAKFRLANFTGAGVIKVGKLGTTIVFR